MKVGRLTLSDRASAGIYEDRSGPEIERVVREILDPDAVFLSRILPDDEPAIAQVLIELVDHECCDVVITTGGTGPGWRDVTPEATRKIIEKELPGFGEAMRAASFPSVPTAILSRALAGIRGATLIINLPGNSKAIEECLRPLAAAIREGVRHLREAPGTPARTHPEPLDSSPPKS